jgi:hypothetical protein
MLPTIETTNRWPDLFESYRFFDERLGGASPCRELDGHSFACGSGAQDENGRTVWRSVWVKLKPELEERVKPILTGGEIGSVRVYIARVTGSLRVMVHDRHYFSQVLIAEGLTEVPEDVKPFVS